MLPLARAGLKVAGIEAGTWMDPHKLSRPTKSTIMSAACVDVRPESNREIPTFRNQRSSPTRRGGYFHPMMNAIGGTSIHYWAQAGAYIPWDFHVRSEVD